MANKEHLNLLRQGAIVWNQWRVKNSNICPDLSEEDLQGTDLSGVNLSEANLRDTYFRSANLSGAYLPRADLCGAYLPLADLSRADLREANLREANLSGAKLNGADLSEANLSLANLSKANLVGARVVRAKLNGANLSEAILCGAKLSGADLSRADLSKVNFSMEFYNGYSYWYAQSSADLSKANLSCACLSRSNLSEANLTCTNLCDADLSEADLTKADLRSANLSKARLRNAKLIETNFEKATLTGCEIYGISAWGLKLEQTDQSNLIITPEGEPVITVDNLEVAQFIYLLLESKKIRDVIDTITSKVVLILGRFGERKGFLDAIRDELRKHNYLPVLFDFEKPTSRDFTETISTLAHLARFIIADITEARSVPQELQAIIPTLAVPVQPLLEGLASEYGLFQDFKKYHWVLNLHRYEDLDDLLRTIGEKVIAPAEAKARELQGGGRIKILKEMSL
ncbi:MAG: pentapeptide repeat-containing protein [Deltaproteobacteria bacterium]|nr:pentapeptide repeat-containing protein [Deltaproteobacteria bacterium]